MGDAAEARRRVCLFQWDNRDDATLGDQARLMERNRLTCVGLENCAYFRTQEPSPDRPVYWQKVFKTRELMHAHPECDIIAYLDSDAVVRRTHVDFFDAKMGDKHALISDDVSRDRTKVWTRNKPFNAGVWAVRNTSQGRDIMQDWASLYDPAQWTRTRDDRWTCGACEWAGDAYEQGSFRRVLDGPNGRHIARVPFAELNNPDCNDRFKRLPADVCHFMADAKRGIDPYLAEGAP